MKLNKNSARPKRLLRLTWDEFGKSFDHTWDFVFLTDGGHGALLRFWCGDAGWEASESVFWEKAYKALKGTQYELECAANMLGSK